MNVDKYISSGILELYVAGVLEEQTMIEVAHNIQQYPKLQAEVEQIENSLIVLSANYAPKISAAKKDKVKHNLLNTIRMSTS